MPAAAPLTCNICSLPVGDRYAEFVEGMKNLSKEFQMHSGIGANIAIFANASDGSGKASKANTDYIARTDELLSSLGFDRDERYCCRTCLITSVDWCEHARLEYYYSSDK
jgi:DNA-directed RNA polymerase subunit N (RpoN/RPB10)